MERKLKVLMSAYACEPGKGSEPEVGWQWALQMARFHDVTVLTRANNRGAIEAALVALRGRQPLPEFVYHDRALFLLDMKRHTKAVKLYYLLWQRSARNVVRRLHAERHFDLMHHVTFAGFRYPAVIWGHGVPSIWGPIGGIESIPPTLLPWRHPRSLLPELVRNANNFLQTMPFHILPKRAAATTCVLVSTAQTMQSFARLGVSTQLMPTIGLRTSELPRNPHCASKGPLRLLFVGNIITLKGVDLAIEALAASGTDATLTLLGEGNYLPAARRLTKRLGVAERVSFRGRLPRAQVLGLYPEFDVFLFASLHDTGAYAVIEAMFNELPVICLDCGGPAVSVRETCGVKIPVTQRAEVIAGLADGIRLYDRDRQRLAEHGRAAREVVLQEYDWDKKGEQMNNVYERASEQAASRNEVSERIKSYSGVGAVTNVLHQAVSFKGAMASLLFLLLVAALGFSSLTLLKGEARLIVKDTLPGLAYAGEANAYLADSTRTLLFIVTQDREKRAKLHEEINSLSGRTSSYLERYKASILSEDERSLYREVVKARAEYFLVRDRILSLAETGRVEEALAQFKEALVPTQTRVKQAGDALLEFNRHQAEQRGQRIMTICTVTQMVVAGAFVLIFFVGFSLGLFR
jgi:glycosyltransferase involved in cell wall biosynthesis